jgi:hypothetical protein
MFLTMNRKLKTFVLFGLVFLFVSCAKTPEIADSTHQQVIVGLSPHMTDSAKEEVYQRLVKCVLESMPINSSVVVYDAYENKSVAKFQIPNKSAFRKTRTRINQFERPLHDLKTYLLNDPESSPEASKNPFDIRFPQWIHFVSRNILKNDADTRIVILGSPFYLDERESGFSMKDGYFPSDAHLSASEDVTIYGLQGHEEDLKGAEVFWGFFEDDWISAAHQEKVIRFWSLFTEGQGGKLEVFCRDLPTVFDQVLSTDADKGSPRKYAIDPDQNRIEMLRIKRDIGSSDWITTTLPDHRKITPPTQLQGPLKIGIRWNGDMDLDLYARAKEGGETLFFEHTESPDGYYYKDHRASPDREFEFIEFEKPVQLKHVRAWVNLFEGVLSRSPVFEVRLEFGNQIYSTQLSIESKSGNRGRTGSQQNHCWVEIDIPGVMGISR